MKRVKKIGSPKAKKAKKATVRSKKGKRGVPCGVSTPKSSLSRGAMLRRLRIASGLSQSALSMRVNVECGGTVSCNQMGIARYECGDGKEMSDDMALELERALRMAPGSLSQDVRHYDEMLWEKVRKHFECLMDLGFQILNVGDGSPKSWFIQNTIYLDIGVPWLGKRRYIDRESIREASTHLAGENGDRCIVFLPTETQCHFLLGCQVLLSRGERLSLSGACKLGGVSRQSFYNWNEGKRGVSFRKWLRGEIGTDFSKKCDNAEIGVDKL